MNKGAHTGFFLSLLSLFGSFSALAEAPWQPFGPGGGSVYSLAVDAGDPARVYAAAGPDLLGFGSLYRSDDRGQTWRVLAGPGLDLVALDPSNPSTVCAGGLRLLCSTDGGRTWSDVSPPAVGSGVLTALAVLPGGAIFAGVRDRNGSSLLYSVDGGRTWSFDTLYSDAVIALTEDPADPGRFYYASGPMVYRSDGPASSPVGNRPVPFIRGLAAGPGTLYAILDDASGRIYRSDDGGGTWRLAGTLPSSPGSVEAILADPRSADRVYAVNGGRTFTSADGGATWRETGPGTSVPFHIGTLALAPSQPGFLYAGTIDWGVAWSGSAGAHWRAAVQPGLTGDAVEMLRFHPALPDTIYVGLGGETKGSRSFRSTDGGRTWQPFARTISEKGLLDLAFDPADPRVLYAATTTGTWKSRDGGGDWSEIIGGGGIEKLATLADGSLLAAGCGASRSTNGGRTFRSVIACRESETATRQAQALWTAAPAPGPSYAVFVLTTATGPGASEVFRSWGGTAWKRLSFPKPLKLLAVAPGDPRVLYGFDFFKTLYRSADAGQSWQLVHGALPFATRLSGGLAVDAADANTIYVGTLDGVLISRDGGRTLAPAVPPFEVEKKAASRLWTAPSRPGAVYAEASDGGLFVGRFE